MIRKNKAWTSKILFIRRFIHFRNYHYESGNSSSSSRFNQYSQINIINVQGQREADNSPAIYNTLPRHSGVLKSIQPTKCRENIEDIQSGVRVDYFDNNSSSKHNATVTVGAIPNTENKDVR